MKNISKKEQKFIQETPKRLKLINKYMPFIIGFLFLVFLFYIGMTIKTGFIDGTIKIMMNLNATSLWINKMFAYPKAFVFFWRSLLISFFLFLMIIMLISFWYEINRHAKTIINLKKIIDKNGDQ